MRMMAHEPAVDPWPIWALRSSDIVFQPFLAISKATAVPMTPVPMMIASGCWLMTSSPLQTWYCCSATHHCAGRIIRRRRDHFHITLHADYMRGQVCTDLGKVGIDQRHGERLADRVAIPTRRDKTDLVA